MVRPRTKEDGNASYIRRMSVRGSQGSNHWPEKVKAVKLSWKDLSRVSFRQLIAVSDNARHRDSIEGSGLFFDRRRKSERNVNALFGSAYTL